MKIHVEGTIDHPSMWTEAFPVAGEALEMLRTDAGAANQTQASRPWPFARGEGCLSGTGGGSNGLSHPG